MNKLYYLSTCSTCSRIRQELKIPADRFILQDIKKEKITAEQLEEMKNLSGSYESLFSRTALKYRQLGLEKKILTEAEYRAHILEDYTFLKRPVLISGKRIFAGNSKNTIAEAKAFLK